MINPKIELQQRFNVKKIKNKKTFINFEENKVTIISKFESWLKEYNSLNSLKKTLSIKQEIKKNKKKNNYLNGKPYLIYRIMHYCRI